MTLNAPTLTWCIVQFDEDMNWWVQEISDKAHWDAEDLSIIDPRQLVHILDLVDPLRAYGLDTDLMENAFVKFRVEKELTKGKIELTKVNSSLFDDEDPVFILPDTLGDEKSPYADFLNHITHLRIKMLNDVINFEQSLTIDELEEELREEQNNRLMETTLLHAFDEITSILDYTPAGYESDSEDEDSEDDRDSLSDDEIPAFEEDESIEEDDTMRWDDDEEDSDDEDADFEDEDDSDEDDHDDEDVLPTKAASKAKPKAKTSKR